MDFGNSKAQIIPRFGTVVQWDNSNQQPLAIATEARNVRYRAKSVATRWGLQNRMFFGAQGSNLSGIGSIRYLSPSLDGTEIIKLLAYTGSTGDVWSATPFNQGTVTQLTTDAFLANANIPRYPSLNPRIIQAFNMGIVAQGDLIHGQGEPLIYDPNAGTIDPVSDKPFATPWTPATRYRVGQMISPSEFITNGLPAAQGVWSAIVTGHFYRVITAGTTDATTQPTWPTTTGTNIGSGTVLFQEYTPTCSAGLPDPSAPITPVASPDGASPILDGATVYAVLTYVSANGESINDVTNSTGNLDTSRVLVFQNNAGFPVDLTFTAPPIPAELAVGGPLGANGATGYNAYVYIVTGVPDPAKIIDGTYYSQLSTTNVPAGSTWTVSTYPIGASLPNVNTANISGTGNVDTGLRWMVVIFELRTEYQTGFSKSAPVPVNVTNAGRNVLAQNIPIGPYNCVRRICAFTVAGASSAGPYTYVDQNDVESPGFNQADINITATTINDNVTTTAQFNFTDTYLPGASDVTNYLQRVEVPPASDAFFSETLSRVIYTGCDGYPSGHLISDFTDSQAIRIPGSNLQVAETNGDRTVCWREFRENQISLKENSGHNIVPNDGDPSTWAANRLWFGSGPVNAKAVAIGLDNDEKTEFLAYAHRNGGFRYVGGEPQLVTKELMGTPEQPGWWDRINWDYGYLIITTIDEKRRELRFSVPFDGSTVRNKVLTCNYFFGWEDPSIFSVRTGNMIPNLNGRRWSLDDLKAEDMLYVPRRYSITPAAADLREQFFLATSDGMLTALQEGQYFDDAYTGAAPDRIGYLSKWVSVPAPNTSLALTQLDGATCSAIGNGFVNIYAYDDTGKLYPISGPARMWMLETKETQRDFGVVAIEALRFGIGFDNGAVVGAWFEMHTANLWVNQTFATRLG